MEQLYLFSLLHCAIKLNVRIFVQEMKNYWQ